MDTCTYELIKASHEKVCEYVKKNCEYSYFNFYSIHYCYFDQNYYYTIPLLILILFICFYLLSDTSNKYLSPALTFISDKLKMSQNLAGVTFLALGNGAPDVISSFVASDNDGGIEFSVGTLIGAGVFVTCIVFSSVVIFAREVKVNKNLFIRDVLLYLLSISLLIVFSALGSITLLAAIGFVSLYVINIILAVWQDHREKKRTKEKDGFRNAGFNKDVSFSQNPDIFFLSIDKIDESNVKFEDLIEENCFELMARKITKNVIQSQHNHLNDGSSHSITNKLVHINSGSENQSKIEDETEEQVSVSTILNATSFHKEDHFYHHENKNKHNHKKSLKRSKSTITNALSYQLTSIKYRLKRNYFKSEQSWDDKGIISKIIFILIDIPFTFFRDLTIPAVELDKWNRIFFIIQPFTCTIYLLLILKYLELITHNLYISSGVVLFLFIISIVLCKYSYRNRLPGGILFICLITFVMSIFWIWSVAKVLLDILNFTGILFNIPDSFLGMTLLSFGNSVPDLTLNCALAKAGYGEMGIAGSIAGPLFNLLIGLGASLIKKAVITGDIPFQLFKYDHISILIAISLLGLNLLRLLIHSICLKFRLTKSVSLLGYLIYASFLVGICLFTFVFSNNSLN